LETRHHSTEIRLLLLPWMQDKHHMFGKGHKGEKPRATASGFTLKSSQVKVVLFKILCVVKTLIYLLFGILNMDHSLQF
jgi:hypothetical protein